MLQPKDIKNIIRKKKEGVLNSFIMQEYNISYIELRAILDRDNSKKVNKK